MQFADVRKKKSLSELGSLVEDQKKEIKKLEDIVILLE
jgi:hypothetical protein